MHNLRNASPPHLGTLFADATREAAATAKAAGLPAAGMNAEGQLVGVKPLAAEYSDEHAGIREYAPDTGE